MIALKTMLILNFMMISFVGVAQEDHWESLVIPGDQWSYLVPNTQPSADWHSSTFDASGWSTGSTGIGHGDGDDATLINTTLSVYMRIEFTVIDPAIITALILDMDYDDGFVAYLNGQEIARSLVSGTVPAFDQPSDGLHEASLYQSIDPDRFEINTDLLLTGTNILAVEVHNESLASSDLSAIPTLSVGLSDPGNYYQSVPVWFDAPVFQEEFLFTSSHLPIVILETEGEQEIPNEPKISAHMVIINRGEGQLNDITDGDQPENIDFDGTIAIEIRGSTSACCSDKKQYALTTYDSLGEKDNVSLLGMPKENDWILNGFAFDPSRLRDYISYQLSLQLGQYASRGHYCEVVLNGKYLGLYVLQEKLKADDNRIDINKIDPEDITDKQLTGGYITKSDKIEGEDVAAWYMDNYLGWQTAFVHEHPKPNEIMPQQDAYIKDQFFLLEHTASTRNSSLINGYPAIIDIPSFIDFMLINELAGNVDAYQYSTFFHKDRNGKLRAGPVWDFNLTYGNDLFFWNFDRSHIDVWQFDNGDNEGARFWKDLFNDPVFNCYMSKRWGLLTQSGSMLHPDQLLHFIDETVNLIEPAVQRDYQRWGFNDDYSQHISAMKSWITARVEWMTQQLGDGQNCMGESVPHLAFSKIHYHPMTEDGSGEKDLEFLEITNIGSQIVDLTGVYFGGTGLVYQFPVNSSLAGGASLYLANESSAFREAYGFEPYDEFSRSLNNGGQTLSLLNGYGNLIDQVTYSDEAPWPVLADGEGYYLSLIDPLSDNNDPTNWEAVNITDLLSSETVDPLISIYPNPTIDKIEIRSQQPIQEWALYDTQGKLIDHQSIQTSYFQMDVSQYTPGLYLLEFITTGKRISRKILISNQ